MKVLMINVSVIIMDEFIVVLMDCEIEMFFIVINKLCKEGVLFVYILYCMEEIFLICDVIMILCDGEYVGKRLILEILFDEVVSMMVGCSIGECYLEWNS